MLVTFFLLAIDCHINGRHRWAFAFLWLCSLGRPETWPFIGLYAIWTWREFPEMRRLIVAGLILIPALWFGIPVLSGNPPFVAGQLAQESPRMLHGNKITGTIGRFRHLTFAPVEIAAGVALVLAYVRRNWNVLLIAGCAALWVLVEIAFALHGWPAVPRYMFEAGGAMVVVAGIGVGWILQEGARISRAGQAGGVALVAVLVGALVPQAIAAVKQERKDLRHEQARTTEIHRLDAALRAFGGYQHIRACGDPSSDVEWVSILAWYTKLDVGYVGHRPQHEIYDTTTPTVLFTALYNGWILHTYHESAAQQQSCGGLNGLAYITDGSHPGGVLVHTQ
jgi:hypothetical protein